MENILVTVTDNLNGFTETIKSVFPQSTTPICVVHQIRNSCKYVVWKEKKEFTADLKNIYKPLLKKLLRSNWTVWNKNGVVNILMPSVHGGLTGKI